MPFDWAEYLRLADELAQRQTDEAALRSAVSRAYYAAFCRACSHLKQQSIPVAQGDGSHQRVWESFSRLGRTYGGVQHNGVRLLRRRIVADYRDDQTVSPQDAQSAVNTAKNILLWLNQLSGQNPSV
jgi:uncharacterized protein (UPF0332 family)